MIAIIDYKVGNVFSLKCSLDKIGAESKVTKDINAIKDADKIILPGVGAFGDASRLLKMSGLDETVVDEACKGKPLLGICLGMQLMFEESTEYGIHKGMGLFKGRVEDLAKDVDKGTKVPHMGWNSINILGDDPILKYTKEGEYVYYVHSFYVPVYADTLVSTNYRGADVSGIVAHGNIYGMQFHPEKSGCVGLNLLKAFNEIR